MWNLKYDTNGPVKQKQNHRHRDRLVVAKVEWVGGGMEWEVAVSRCKLLYIEWINDNVLLYSTGNYIQYPVINHNGKEYIKKRMYIYV